LIYRAIISRYSFFMSFSIMSDMPIGSMTLPGCMIIRLAQCYDIIDYLLRFYTAGGMIV
jgi:hypothetical protein